MSENSALHLNYDTIRPWHSLIVGRAGLDLYPQPDGCKIKDALSFSSDLGGSAGNIAVAMAKAGAKVGLISALSKDAVGDFVKQRLKNEGVDISLTTDTTGHERTSLALAEVRQSDCEVVIYRNNPADLKVQFNGAVKSALSHSNNLVVTGTSFIDPDSRAQTLEMMYYGKEVNCRIWLDLDYRAWNWPSLEITRSIYREASAQADVLVGNEEELALLHDDVATQIKQCREQGQVMILKRGSSGAALYAGDVQLNCGIYTVESIKPYGSGDAFLGNLLVHYMNHRNWMKAMDAGSAAAALVVSRRGCASAMPTPGQLESLQQGHAMMPAAHWTRY